MTKHEKLKKVSSESSGVLNSIRWSIIYIITIPLIVCAIILWIAYQRISDFEAGQREIARSTVTPVGKEVSELIKNYQRLVRIFSQNELETIKELSQAPNNIELKNLLQQRLKEYFPDYFTFTLAGHDGIPIIDDFEGFIGEVCLQDIMRVARGEPQFIHVHPNPAAYHIDIMTRWGSNERGGIFFVSFHIDSLSKLLKLSSPPKQELMLISSKYQNLIEITEAGERLTLDRDDFRLTMEEQERILYSVPIMKTNWSLVDFYERNLFSDYRKNTIFFSATIILLFITGSVIMTFSLLRSEKRRLAAERVKEEMFSILNHDLRSPLNSIYATLKLFADRSYCEKTEETQKLAMTALNNSQTMLGFIDDILDIQKMELEGMALEFGKVELVSFVESTLDMNAQYGKMHNVTFKLLKPEREIYIHADQRRLQQALTNLLSNAIKYSPENDTVTVLIASESGHARISVSDNGPGIPSDFQDKVFEKFAQSKSKLKKTIPGTGLGLAIVKHIIDGHQGRVYLDTEAKQGTTFHIELPLIY